MSSMQSRIFAAVTLVALVACAKEKQPEAPPAAPPAVSPVVSSPPSATTTALATAPDAPATATSATSVASGPLTENTAQPGDAGDSAGVAQIDVDGDSTAQSATVLWDDEVKVLYIATTGCAPSQAMPAARVTLCCSAMPTSK